MVIECMPPNDRIHEFDARAIVLDAGVVGGKEVTASLSSSNFLCQGTFLKDTEFIHGLAIYTGNETKLCQNKNVPMAKLTRLDCVVDRMCRWTFLVQFVATVALGLCGSILESNDRHRPPPHHPWYLAYVGGWQRDSESLDYLIIPTRMLLLLSYMIPISLRVSLDLMKYFCSQFISWVRCYS